MARSIEAFGVIQPIVVRTVGTDYELVAGERRWRAAQEAGLERIPAIVKQSTETDSLEIALIENLHRSDLNGIEEASAYQQLLDDFAITHEELSRRVGKSRAAISNTIRLLQLPTRIQKEVIDGRISTGHARALLALQEQPELQEKVCSRVIAEGLSVRQIEQLVGIGEAGENQRARREKPPLPDEVREILSRLGEALDTRVKGTVGKRKGKVVIEFRNLKDLRRIVSAIVPPQEAVTDTTDLNASTEAEPRQADASDRQKAQALLNAGAGADETRADGETARGARREAPEKEGPSTPAEHWD
jgi:ParB family chromosome partitioning protein